MKSFYFIQMSTNVLKAYVKADNVPIQLEVLFARALLGLMCLLMVNNVLVSYLDLHR